MLSGCKDMESYLLTSKVLIHALKKGAEVLWSAIWRYWSATWRYWSLLGCSSLPAPPAGTAGCATGRRRLQGCLLSPGPTAVWAGGIMDWGREAADCYHWRWWWGGLGPWWERACFPAKSVCQTSLPCDCKKAFARHVGGSHNLETSNQAQMSPILPLALKTFILGNRENKKPPLLHMRCLKAECQWFCTA